MTGSMPARHLISQRMVGVTPRFCPVNHPGFVGNSNPPAWAERKSVAEASNALRVTRSFRAVAMMAALTNFPEAWRRYRNWLKVEDLRDA